MNTLVKNIILTAVFAILIISLFLTDSTLIQVILAVVAFLATIALSMQQNSTASTNSEKILGEFLELIEFKRNQVATNDDTSDRIEKSIIK